jgi:hypothetical protein
MLEAGATVKETGMRDKPDEHPRIARIYANYASLELAGALPGA